MMIVTVKYVLIVMRAHNKGEGGSLALLALISRSLSGRRWTAGIVMLGVLATALFFGDAMITPAISVLSAVEGLTVVQDSLRPLVIPISVGILIGLFLIQRLGTARVGGIFGPIMLVYFAVLAGLGAINIARHPEIVGILNPWWAFAFFQADFHLAFLALGSVVLAVTGAETLYADMGHFGRKAVSISWLYLVFPCLMLNYMGQGALMLDNPAAAENPFFLMAPEWARLPLVFLATIATVIASQAVISGAFSVTQQAVQLGFLPRVRIAHTSDKAVGQIYVPIVNWGLLIFVIMLVLGFRSSSNLAAAYGIAVTGTMFITACMIGVLTFSVWRWNRWLAGLVTGAFLLIDGAYFASNLTKIPDGGWFPLLVALVAFTLLTTWATGRRLLRAQMRESAMPMEAFLKTCIGSAKRVPGTAVFMAADPNGVPHALLHNMKHNKVLHERVIIITVAIADMPYVEEADHIEVEGSRRRLLADHPPLRLHAGDRRARRPRPGPPMRARLQVDGHQLLPRPPDPDPVQAAGHGDMAREIVRLDGAEFRKRDGILQAAHQPRDRARQPGRDLKLYRRAASCLSQASASATIVSSRSRSGRQARVARIALLSATKAGGSPARRGEMRRSIVRLVTRSTLSSTSSTEKPRP